MYRIDLTTILRVFAHQSGKLDTDVKHIPGIKERCHAQLILINGKVVSCIIEGVSGILYSGGDALYILQNIGILEWSYTPETQNAPPISTQLSPALPNFAENIQTLFPIRTRLVEPREFAIWSRWQRSVYNLTDGSKSVDEIARVLSQPRERIIETLTELQRRGVITLRRNSHSQ